MVPHELLGREREEHLAAVTCGEDTCHPVERQADVVALTQIT